MAPEIINISEEVYERLTAHRRGEESISETLERLLEELESDWRTHAGFLSEEEAGTLEAEVARGFKDTDDSLDDRGHEIDKHLSEES